MEARVAACEAAAAAVKDATAPERNAVWSRLFPMVLEKRQPLKVREAVAWAGRHMQLTAVNNLVAHAVPDAPAVRAAMVRALADIGRRPLPPYFEGRLHEELARLGPDLDYAAFVNLTLMFGSEPRVVEVLRRGLEAANPLVRQSAAQQLAALGEMDAAVTALRSGESSEVRAAAASALGYYWTGDEAAAAALLEAEGDPDPDVARAATVARRRLKLGPSPRPPARAATPDAEVDDRYPWLEFLRRWSGEWLRVEQFVLEQPDEVVESGWLGLPAATEAELAALERRLGRRLPRSYRAFLATSSGFRGGGPSIRRIRPAAEVRPFVEEELEWVDIWLSADPDGGYEPLRTAIQVSDVEQSTVYLLCPDLAGEDGEWEAWLFASWIPGAQRHRSWWELMQAEHRSFLELET